MTRGGDGWGRWETVAVSVSDADDADQPYVTVDPAVLQQAAQQQQEEEEGEQEAS